MKFSLHLPAIFLILCVGPVWAYEEVAVTNCGIITGRVTNDGDQPRPMAFNLVTIPDAVYCGRISTGTRWRFVEDFIIGPGQALKDVVVMLKGVTKGKPFQMKKVRIDALDCDFFCECYSRLRQDYGGQYGSCRT
jgi:hypothetical protein